jgi:glycosyltransferase involved in cell wall biosynthesis
MLHFLLPDRKVPDVETYDGIRQEILPVQHRLLLGNDVSRLFRTNALGGDIYHFHSSTARHRAASRLLKVPYIVSPHGAYMPPERRRKRVKDLVFRLMLGRAYVRRAALVHAITAAEQAAVLRYAGRVQTVVVPNALQSTLRFDVEARAETRARLKLAPEEQMVFFLGRLDVNGKGLDALCEGFSRAIERSAAPMRLVLAGVPWGVPIEPMLSDAALQRTLLLPAAFGLDKVALLSAADRFVTLSRWDVMPTAVLDALSTGLPLLVTEETGFGDFVRRYKAGKVVTHDPDVIANALLDLKPQPLARRQELLESAKTEFDPARIAARFIELYEGVLAKKPIEA